jgi:hypothetical protein
MLQRQRLFPAAPEHERIAALEPDHPAPPPRRPNHQRVNFRLRQGVAPGPLSDEEALSAPRQPKRALVDQRVVEHEIGRTEARNRSACQQIGVTGAGANERNMSDQRVLS